MDGIVTFFRKLFGIQTDEEKYEAGRNYVREQIGKYGIGNTHEMNRLWAECECSMDRSWFDIGMQAQLDEYNVPDPADPLC